MASAECVDPCTSSSSSFPVESLILNYKMMKPLDKALRCSICFDYYKNCMMTKCSHNYCSVCIRKYMTYKSQCPTCFQDASEPELRNNRLIDEILRLYRKLRGGHEEEDTYPIKTSNLPLRTIYVKETSDSFQSTSKLHSPSSKSKDPSARRIKIEIPDETETHQTNMHVNIKIEPDFDEVTCPVCYNIVLADKINTHLDSCLKQQFDDSDRRKTLPKLVYHLLSEKEIKMKLKEHGLNTAGDRQTLIRRHKNFITLYNANCDSLNPKPVSELVQEIDVQEIEERVSSIPKQIQVNKKSEMSQIEHQHQSYIKKHESQFNALINDIHQRQITQFISSYGRTKIKQEPQDSTSYECEANKVILNKKVNEDSISDISTLGSEMCKDDDTDSSSSDDMFAKKVDKNFHRKRKKATVSIKNQDSPKKK